MSTPDDVELPQGTRVPKSRTVHLPVTETQYRRLKATAEDRCVSVAELLRFACERSGLFHEGTSDQETST